MRNELPSGTVTFLFTDVEGSTRLLHELGSEAYATALAEHRRLIRAACTGNGGVEVDTQGDAFFVAFPTAPGALSAAHAMTDALRPGPIRVRVGIHTGTPLLGAEGYIGHDVHKGARIAAAGHGGQVLVSAATAALLGSAGLHDLGEHRLKDLSAPERIYQLGDNEFPPLTSLYRTNLPVPATPFLGRATELAEIGTLLSRADSRLLTLTGPGGTGKTRLALQAAGLASDAFPDGLWWVPLAALRDPRLVLETAAQALGARDGLADHIAAKRLLLLFDNFEQVVEAAADLAGLLAACPNLQLLVTSRERLRLEGEQTYPVPPLAESDGVALFIARARAVDLSFTASKAVGELCVRLDELPLALELAAARTAIFSPEQLLDRLSQRLDLLKGARDADPRQQTLRATIEWSHDLLTSDEQKLFRRLSVFLGGCTYEAAERVAGSDPDTLQSLLDKSLLRKRASELGPRYWMLETIREYATDRLEGSGEAQHLQRRHAEHFLALAEAAEPNLRWGPREWLDRLEREHDNIRAALDRLGASGETELALRLAGAMWRLWQMRGPLSEGRRRLDSALNADARPTAARARALNGAAVLAIEGGGDFAIARHRVEEALGLHRTLGDPWGTAFSEFMLAQAVYEAGDLARAEQLFDQSARVFRELGDQNYTLLATSNLAATMDDLGNRERARALYEDTARLARDLPNERALADALGSLAMMALDETRASDALSLLMESLRIGHGLGDRLAIAVDLRRVAHVLAVEGRADTAARLLSCSETLREEIGYRRTWVIEGVERALAAIRTQLDDAAFAEAWVAGRGLTADEAVALALEERDT